jgi:hypothetical protein
VEHFNARAGMVEARPGQFQRSFSPPTGNLRMQRRINFQ